jgi:hypothetical protein
MCMCMCTTSVFFINSTNEIFLYHFFIIKLNLYSVKFYKNHIFTINLSLLHSKKYEKNTYLLLYSRAIVIKFK